ncbi:hypothetical protein LJB85_00140 [Porphyromonadaceae bacterium OttesenSCG-928-L07]|nr:hypothetical protein [Porphyromonadaceae bacterium OttesenSCG-928-L07]MDL2330985.1 hypothetical protein [Odoribacter sp. OttesenSCG-928-A06]
MLEGYDNQLPLTLTYGNKKHILKPDVSGCVSFSDPQFTGVQEGAIRYGEYTLPTHLESGEHFNVYINLTPSMFGAEFYGRGAEKNKKLNLRYAERVKADTSGQFIYGQIPAPDTTVHVEENIENIPSDSTSTLRDSLSAIVPTEKSSTHEADSILVE